MTNVHPFPRAARSKPGKKPGPAFTLPDAENQPVDVLLSVVQTGGAFLTISQDQPPENHLPTAPFWRTNQAVQVFDDLTDVLLLYAQRHPDDIAKDDADELSNIARQSLKFFRKLRDHIIPDELMISIPSLGPDFLVESLTVTAIAAATDFAIDLLNFYDLYFIKTKKDRRKDFFRDFHQAFEEAHEQSLHQIEDHKMVVRDLASVHRALGKHLDA
ncbi:hypothetical protein JKG47_11370 [Acidithiobacillus sp. MC6.1]|nr:hypothetical protein [Acidithiobacillus sp. MC6.1]